MPGNFNGDDTIISISQEQIEILKTKYFFELMTIGALLLMGEKKIADDLAFEIMKKEGLL